MLSYSEKSMCSNVLFLDCIEDFPVDRDVSSKKLCIIKTDFKKLSPLKRISAKYPQMEIWLAGKNITRENIFAANKYDIKNVLPYPYDLKPIMEFFRNKKEKNDSHLLTEVPYWIKGMKVMIVDDNEMNVSLLEETLSDTGVQIRSFTNPFDAADAVSKERFDLFLLDIMMPDMSGFELGEIIRKSELNSQSLMMFISALSDRENKITGYNLGSVAYIEKPFDVDVVRCQITSALKTKQLNDAMNDTKESFLAMVTHDLKSPVNSEIAALELLLKNFSTSNDIDKEDIISDILGATKYMKNLIENVLNKYRYDNQKYCITKELHPIKNLIEESIEETKYSILNKQQRIQFVNRAKTKMILIDYLELKRVIHNLLTNATEYAPKHSVIEIDVSENKKYIVFAIKNENNGHIIKNPDDLFDKFVSQAKKNKKISSGLGLYISKKVIEAHDGSISIDVKDPKYVRFVFTLPK
ncbi:TPA: response regulator [Candidatus Scatousia excrementigallinarum]|uniref:Response regulator n=1 Tax=Candidatus Scatousia excrementigallinarum TaxID=2840935 RepID=A0A9D1F020_9BACT|nr:response regulator [Candidatus Scatousia excrementigallinarum]